MARRLYAPGRARLVAVLEAASAHQGSGPAATMQATIAKANALVKARLETGRR